MHYYHFSVLFSRDHDLIFSWSRHNESCGSQRKKRFQTASFGSHADIPVPQVDWQWNWLHVQGRYIVLDDKVADPTASFSSVAHLCVSRQSLTDTELFQFEWVPNRSKSEYDHPWCCDDAASIAFSHAEYTEKIKSWSRENNFRYVEITRKLIRDHEKTTFVMSRSRQNNFRYVEITTKQLSLCRDHDKTTFVMSRSRQNNFRYVEITRKLSRDHEKTRRKNYNNAWPLRTCVPFSNLGFIFIAYYSNIYKCVFFQI